MNNYVWTSVKEALPTEKGEYLVTLKYKEGPYVITCKFIPHYNEHDDPNENINLSFGDPTELKEGDPVWYYTDDSCTDEWGLIVDSVIDNSIVMAWMEFPKPYEGD